ncbi:MAG: glycosyltransferase family 1 protein [Smithella sp.]|jgi:glycosyltransferase involved in cell wall biosynthesis
MNATKKKIGLFLTAPPHGGGEFQYSQSILEAALALPENRHELIVAFASDQWLKLIPTDSIRIMPLRSDGFMWQRFKGKLWLLMGMPLPFWRKCLPFLIPDVRKILQENCDLWIFPAQDTWSYLLPVPSLSVIHDLMHRYERRFPEVSSGFTFRQREKHYKYICRYSEGILVDSEVGKNHVMESYGMTNEKLYILPYVAPSYIEKEEGMLNDMRHYNLPPKFLFYPAQFWKHKNHDKLIRAIGNLLGRIPDLKIVFTGSPKNAYEDVKTLISNLSLSNQIILLGYVPDEDMTAIYRRARALIMPTYFGPTNIPPLEAFSLGCPVAVSRIYGMPEQVGDAALLFDPSSDTEIAEIIYRLWTDDELCNTLSRKGRERAAIWDKNAFEKQFAKIVSSITKK